ncbi:MAG TPA: GntR family transcriptional regulator [Thermoanaerobaculia bacterium]|nr:GntR family transcriptional regulator [Thermoanaerobaculia bacterium]
MAITIDLRSTTPLEDQLRSQIRELIALGKLVEGECLPSVRQLAGDLAIHFNTVARAYRRLQDEGLLAIGRGRGVFVKELPSRRTQSVRQTRETLGGRLREIFVDARLIGLTAAQTREFVLDELEQFARKEKRS